MVPFRIQCETCQARLKVSSPEVIGQVHSCPRCGSMVHLLPPPGWGEPPESNAVSAPNAEAETPSNEPATAAPAPAPDFSAVGDLGISLTASTMHESLATGPGEPGVSASKAASNGTSEASTSPDLTQEPAFVASTQATAKWVSLGIAAGGTVLFLAAGLVYWFASGSSDAGNNLATAQQTSPEAPVALLEPDQTSAPELGPLPAATEPLAAATEPSADAGLPELGAGEPELPVLPEVSSAPNTTAASPPLPEAEQPTSSDPELPLLPPKQPSPEPAPTTPELPSEPDRKPFDPLDFDPSSLDLILTRGPAKPEKSEPPPEAKADEATDLDARLANADAGADTPNGLDARLQGIAQDANAAVRRGPTGPAPAPPEDPLAVVIPEIQLAEMPLDRVVRLLSAVAGTPVTIEPDALRYAGIQGNRSTTLRGTGESIESLFTKVLGPVRLEIGDEGRGMCVSRIGAGKPRKASFAVSDLVRNGDADELRALIETLLPDLRAVIRSEGDRLQVDGPASDHMEIAIFCERLRKARGLKLQSRYPANLLRVTPPLAELDQTLKRKMTCNYIDYTPLPEVFEQWRRATGLTVLVDWATLADEDVLPSTTIAVSVNDRPRGEALTAILSDLGLGWRVLDARTIQVTTASQAQSSATVEFYPVPRTTNADELTRTLIANAGTTVHYDEPSRMLIVRAGNEGHRLALEATRGR